MLIRAYGLMWNPDTVDWGKPGAFNKGSLKGEIVRETKTKKKRKKYTIDFWEVEGLYVLHSDFKPLYVGKADARRLGPRLRDHLTDRFAGRWDMFSWFSLSTVTVGQNSVREPGTRQVQPQTLNSTLEALAILIADPPLNRRRESLPEAIEAEQVRTPYPRTVRRYLEEILQKLDKFPAAGTAAKTKNVQQKKKQQKKKKVK